MKLFFWILSIWLASGIVPFAYAQIETDKDILAVTEQLESEQPEWLFDELDVCPADVASKSLSPDGYNSSLCSGQRTQACLKKCRNGDSSSCYTLALKAQALQRPDVSVSEALFTRACRLGEASGCTNRAATLKSDGGPEDIACAVRTFRLSCRARDPWGCTMLAFELFEGENIDQDFDEALEVMSQSCQFGVEDPACTNALALEKEIKRRQDEQGR